ncbi:GNAT family protein [Streptomyces sp. NPDC089799]|uniref:GNAT family N-acetyltransferase n=1 Tax=Streptomyces sp. NPDC089799 TaxID=3155066 RepID=UPI00343A2DB4
MIIDGVEMRDLRADDAGALADALARNRANMRAVEPDRPDAFYTAAGQRARIDGMLAERDGGRMRPYLLVHGGHGDHGGHGGHGDQGEEVVGAVNLGTITHGPLCSGGIGYWVDRAWRGRGLAYAAVEEVLRIARDEVGLHRVEAGTLTDNHASQRVLAKAGFERYGTAPRYLHINGAWRDHHLFQRLLHDDPPYAVRGLSGGSGSDRS